MKSQDGPLVTGPLTIEEFERLPDEDCRMELVRGYVVRESLNSFEHGTIAAHLGSLLLEFVMRHRLGTVVGASCGFALFKDPPTVRAPDAAFIRAHRMDFDPERYPPLAPDLSIEILSPWNTMSTYLAKVLDYLNAGSRMIWLVDPGSRTVTVYQSREEIRILTEVDEIDGGDVLPGFRLRVSELSAR